MYLNNSVMNNHNIIKELEIYRDKVYVYNVLTEKASDYYNNLKSFVNVPMILASSAMSIINSSFDANDMKIPNIVLNCVTALMISLVANFKIPEKANTFRTISLKHNKLLHFIEEKLSDRDEVDLNDMRAIISQYDEILEQTDLIPNHIKKKVTKMFSGKRHLPIILCDNSKDMSPNRSRPTSNSEQSQIIICDIQNTHL